jgi:RNA polymerase sigma-70 factor (ECF subfamily)
MIEDNRLLTAFKSGNNAAFDALVRKYQDRIYNLCRHMLVDPDDAADAAQDTFVKTYQGLMGFTRTSTFYTWLYRIAVNTCLDYQRKFSLRSIFFPPGNEEYLNFTPSATPSPEAACADRQSMHVLRDALRRLSKKLRVVIVLKELEGLSYEEIAEVLDVSVGTVKSRISRAREELKKHMKKFMEQK